MIASIQRLAACLSTNSKQKGNLADEGKNRVEDHVGDQNCTDEDTGRIFHEIENWKCFSGNLQISGH